MALLFAPNNNGSIAQHTIVSIEERSGYTQAYILAEHRPREIR